MNYVTESYGGALIGWCLPGRYGMSTSSPTNFAFHDTLKNGRESASDCTSGSATLLALENVPKIAVLPLASSQLTFTSAMLHCHMLTYEDRGGRAVQDPQDLPRLNLPLMSGIT